MISLREHSIDAMDGVRIGLAAELQDIVMIGGGLLYSRAGIRKRGVLKCKPGSEAPIAGCRAPGNAGPGHLDILPAITDLAGNRHRGARSQWRPQLNSDSTVGCVY